MSDEDRRRLIHVGDHRQIHCDCGRWLPLDVWTECDRCGAHYEVQIKQTAPPVEECNSEGDV